MNGKIKSNLEKEKKYFPWTHRHSHLIKWFLTIIFYHAFLDVLKNMFLSYGFKKYWFFFFFGYITPLVKHNLRSCPVCLWFLCAVGERPCENWSKIVIQHKSAGSLAGSVCGNVEIKPLSRGAGRWMSLCRNSPAASLPSLPCSC